MASRGRALGVAALLAASLAVGMPTAAADDDSEVGYDVSHPQCGDHLPDAPAFGVVGVNGGLPTRPNPCLAEQLAWAAEEATGEAEPQPEVQLYVNTANPGQVRHLVTTWPSRGRTPYGQGLDRRDQLTHRVQAENSQLPRERRLINDLDGAVHPVDRPHGAMLVPRVSRLAAWHLVIRSPT